MFEYPSRTYAAAAPEDVAITDTRDVPIATNIDSEQQHEHRHKHDATAESRQRTKESRGDGSYGDGDCERDDSHLWVIRTVSNRAHLSDALSLTRSNGCSLDIAGWSWRGRRSTSPSM